MIIRVFPSFSVASFLSISMSLMLGACSGSEATTVGGNGGTAGNTGTPSGGSPGVGGAGLGGTSSNGAGGANAGAPSTGSNAPTGGSNSSAGAKATGGMLSTGGAKATGGTVTNGGAAGTGGSKATGGLNATGGSKATGGTTSTGGSKGTGGVPATGGSKGTGGAPATGGARPTGGNSATGGTTTSSSTNPPITGSTGFTTRYWDCAKPSCAWTANSNPPVPSCTSDGTTRANASTQSGWDTKNSSGAFECYDFSPWYDSSTNMAYGFAAYNAAACGVCYELQFTGSGHYGTNAGATALSGKQMIVQVINIGSIAAGQFDLLIPGGGVGANNACQYQWPGLDIGSTSGGFLAACSGNGACAKTACDSAFAGKPALVAGCDWFAGWFSSADNPNLVYKQVTCPSQITSKSGISR